MTCRPMYGLGSVGIISGNRASPISCPQKRHFRAQTHFTYNVLLVASVSDTLPTLACRESGALRQSRDGFSITWTAIHA